MTNLEQIRGIRKNKKKRKLVSRVGGFLAVIGLILIVCATSDRSTNILNIILLGISGCGLFGIGISIVNFIDRINKERPLVYKPAYQGDDLWYTMYTNLKKRSDIL